MATNLRLQGGKTNVYTRTIDNQVGVDTASLSIRTIPALTDLNCKYFDKSGGAGGTGTAADPYLTAQQAIDAAVAAAGGAFAYAGCQDSGVYSENIDLKGIILVAVDGFYPEIKQPTEEFVVLDDFAHDAYCLIEWTISGVVYILAGTADGIYRSSDGGVTFASWVLAGKEIKSMVFFNSN